MENQKKPALLQRYLSDGREKRMFDAFIGEEKRKQFDAMLEYRRMFMEAERNAPKTVTHPHVPRAKVLDKVPVIRDRTVTLNEIDKCLEEALREALRVRTVRAREYRFALEPRPTRPVEPLIKR